MPTLFGLIITEKQENLIHYVLLFALLVFSLWLTIFTNEMVVTKHINEVQLCQIQTITKM